MMLMKQVSCFDCILARHCTDPHSYHAEHGLRVLDLIEGEPYIACLMDLDMPVCDGFESTARVRALGGRYEELPIIAVTAGASLGYRDRCLGAGFNGECRLSLGCLTFRSL